MDHGAPLESQGAGRAAGLCQAARSRVPCCAQRPDVSPQSLELIRKHGLSAALFAPGWVYECLEKTEFFQNQDK